MIITYVLDKAYIDLARISIASYKAQNPEAQIVVVSEKPITENMGQDENFVCPLPRTFRNRGQGDRISNAAYLKCYLPLILPYDKIIYVDADTICQRPLKNLWEMKCKYINLCETYDIGKIQARAIGAQKYGLTGMMVMNLRKLRKINFTAECMFVEKECPTPTTGWQHDETCINIAMRNKLHFIDKKWNYCHNRRYENPINEVNAYILHFVGSDKVEMTKGIRYKTMRSIGKYIYKKRIAIVGNAESLFDSTYGHEIDNHDFIIRFNRGFITKPISQGSRTDLVILALTLTPEEIKSYNSRFVANRSRFYQNETEYQIPDIDRGRLTSFLEAQPSSGFIAIDMCLYYEAAQIDLYGFDWEATRTFYNPDDYVTQHKYDREKQVVQEYEKLGLLKINKKSS